MGRLNVSECLKCLWKRIKIPSFAHRSSASALSGAGRNNLFEMPFESIKTPHFAYRIDEICRIRNHIFEYLLFEIVLGRHQNTKFCKSNARV